eukprot:1485455-Alexandrium_andersonii.AAC.1
MSASLVGSEMCIRDSCPFVVAPLQTSKNGAALCAPRLLVPMQVVQAVPVSYTHLTLPTICSV